MNKAVSNFKNTSPLKFILISIALGIIATFLEDSFKNIFLFLRIVSFGLFVYAVIKYFNSKN
ncbi:MAG: hypothetical protein DCF13_03490 [Flavobacteriaceae bacterium]|jgi:hypothetical protein|nr:MAG: hypothetical protein DCF13_03490 [Flavobacteriaceae bacterium]